MIPTVNEQAFLDMLAFSELGEPLLGVSDDGYNVIVGSTAQSPKLFASYADHPRQAVWIQSLGVYSTAAGRYQVLERYFDVYKHQLNLPDFGHASQDAIALQMIGECGALETIEAGNISLAITQCSSRWASLPGNAYGQHQNQLSLLANAFTRAGGTINP